MIKHVLTLAAMLTALVFANPASAQHAIAGNLRLHLETDVLSIVNTNPEGDDNSRTQTTIGPGQSGLGLGIGYGISEELIIGGNFALQYLDGEGEDDGAVRVALYPYLEVILGSGDARPFLGGMLLLSVVAGDNVTVTEFGVGGLGGVHLFLTDTFSFDISGRLFLSAGNTSRETPMGDDIDTSFTRFGLLVYLGVSGWGI